MMAEPPQTVQSHPSSSQPVSARRRTRLLWVLILGAAAAGAWFGGWYSLGRKDGAAAAKAKAAPIIIAPVTRDAMPVTLSALGTVQAYQAVTVHSRVDGELLSLHFTEGKMVNAGDVLARIDDRTYRAARDQAAANLAKDAATLANARLDLERYQTAGDSIARQVLEAQQSTVKQLQAAVAADQAALQSAVAQLSYCTIKAPISGRTGIRGVDVGNLVHASDTTGIVTLTQLEPISVIFSLPQQRLPEVNARLNAGATLQVEALDSDKNAVIDTGVVELVDNQVDETTGTVKLKATFPNRTHALWPGGFANIRLTLDTHANALVIPTVAIQRGPQGAYVFRYDAAEKEVRLAMVNVGVTNGETSEIISGVGEGDKIVTDGMAKLQDKTKVRLSKSTHQTPEDMNAVPAADPAVNPAANPAADGAAKSDAAPQKDTEKKAPHVSPPAMQKAPEAAPVDAPVAPSGKPAAHDLHSAGEVMRSTRTLTADAGDDASVPPPIVHDISARGR